jgi:hypothetical protein
VSAGAGASAAGSGERERSRSVMLSVVCFVGSLDDSERACGCCLRQESVGIVFTVNQRTERRGDHDPFAVAAGVY